MRLPSERSPQACIAGVQLRAKWESSLSGNTAAATRSSGQAPRPTLSPRPSRGICCTGRRWAPRTQRLDRRSPPSSKGGPLTGRRIDVDVVEGRPPKTIDVPADDGSTFRYCLEDWTQTGPSAIYTFLYLV